MIYRIIISHCQTEYLSRFPGQAATAVVLDCLSTADLATCEALGYSPVVVTVQGGRGQNRNAGLAWFLQNAPLRPDDIVEFFDGDRYPVCYDASAVEALVHRHSLDALLYTCQEYDARCEKIEVPATGAALVDTGTVCNPFYSCGFAVRVSAIMKVLEFNQGCLFEPRFTGWGCEDQYLGLVCHRLGLRTAITAEVQLAGRVGGDSHLHKDYKASLQQYIDLIREKCFEVRSEPRIYEILV